MKERLVNRMKTLDKYLEEQLQNKEFKEEWENMQLQMNKEFLFLETTITRAEVKKAFYELREQAADIPEMLFDEINAEISAARAESKK